jgi:hypothetical protein
MAMMSPARKTEHDADEERPGAVQGPEDQLAADEPRRGRCDAAPEHERVLALVGRGDLESQPEDGVAIDRHEDRKAQDDDRVDEGSDRRQGTTQSRNREVGHALEDLAQSRMERSGDVDRDTLPVEPRLDVVQERRRARREVGQRSRELGERVDQRRDDPHDHQRADQDDWDDHGDHGDPSRESRQAPLEKVGDRGDEEREQPGEEEDKDQPEVILEVPCQEPEDHEGDCDGRQDDQHLDPFGPTLQHVSRSACRPAVGVRRFHTGCTVPVHLALPIPISTDTIVGGAMPCEAVGEAWHGP